MKSARRCVLTINGGSSSIRFAVYEAGDALRRQLDGKIDRIGSSGTNLAVSDPSGTPPVSRGLAADSHRSAVGFLLDWLEAEAVALFCYQAKKWIGSFAAALGGLDTLVFAGGFGEHAPLIRERICDGLGFLGIELNQKRNTKNAPLISRDTGRVTVRVIRTDEELMIARSVVRACRGYFK